MYILENGSDTLRLGVSVSKKVGNSIVRHRLARLIRESFRLNSKSIMKGYDIVFVARNNLKGKGFYETQKSMLHLLKASSILMESENDKKDSDRNH
jgi:ribonuclease P protein component